MTGERRGRAAAVLALMALCLAFFTFPMWSTSRLLYQGGARGSEVTEQTFPAQVFFSRHLKAGSLPLWDPDIACGFPLLAEGQSGALYPANLALSLAFDPVAAFNLSIIISLFLSMIFSYLLLRHYGLSTASALFGAVSFAFSGFMLAKLKFPALLAAACWLPLAVLGLEKTFFTRHLKHLALTSLALAMQFLAAGPQVFLITLSVIVLVFCFRLAALFADTRGEDRGARRRMLAALCMAFLFAVAIGAALAAPQLMPMAQGAAYFKTAASDGTFAGSTGTAMRARDLDLFINPYRHGNPAEASYDVGYSDFWESIAYPGLLTLVLALVALLFLARRDRTVQMWLLIGLLALAMSLGSNTPLAEFLWKYVPGFKSLYYFQRYLVVVVLATAVLGGKGLDHVLSRFEGHGYWKAAVLLLVFAVLLADLGLFASKQVTTVEAESILEPGSPGGPLLARDDDLQGQRIAVLGYGEAWSRAVRDSRGWLGDKRLFIDCLRLLPAGYNGVLGIAGEGQPGNRILASREIYWVFSSYGRAVGAGWAAEVPDTAVNLLAVQGVSYVLSPYLIDNSSLALVREEAAEIAGVTYRLYHIASAAPRAYIATEVLVDQSLQGMPPSGAFALFFDPSQVSGRALVEREPTLIRGGASAGEARVVSDGDTRVVVEARCPEGGMLVLNDSYFPEWRVRVDGEERELLRANLAFRAVELEAGDHTVEFLYRPLSLYYGLALAAAVLLLLLLVFLHQRQSGWLDLTGAYYASASLKQVGPGDCAGLAEGIEPRAAEGPSPGRVDGYGSGGAGD